MNNKPRLLLILFLSLHFSYVFAQFDINDFSGDWKSYFEFAYGFNYNAKEGGIVYDYEDRYGISIYLKSELFDSATWDVDFTFDPIVGNNNFLRYYLASDDFAFIESHAIFLECVSEDTVIRLCEQLSGGAVVEILRMKIDSIKAFPIRIQVVVTRNCDGEWTVSFDSGVERQVKSTIYLAAIKTEYSGFRVRMDKNVPTLLVIHSMGVSGVKDCDRDDEDDGESGGDTIGIGSLGSDVGLHSIVITELMADPEPSNGLPEVEYVEIYNRTDSVVCLVDYKLSVGSEDGLLGMSYINSKGYAVLCSEHKVAEMLAYSDNVIPVKSFKSLINDGRVVSLYSSNKSLVTWFDYDKSWYRDKKKEEGGYSIERIDEDNLNVSPLNFRASTSRNGGTPGCINTVRDELPDNVEPRVVAAYLSGEKSFCIEFNKEVGVRKDNIEVDGYVIDSIDIRLPYRNRVEVYCGEYFDSVLNVSLRGIRCVSGYVLPDTIIDLHVLLEPRINDLMINEIMYDPESEKTKYIELYNSSNRYIDISRLFIERYDREGAYVKGEIVQQEFIEGIRPNSYVVLVDDIEMFKRHYDYCSDSHICLIEDDILDREGGALALRIVYDNRLIDSVVYSDVMHNAWLSDTKGVSLEKKDEKQSEFDKLNWTSANSGAGYNTAGCKNSHISDVLITDHLTTKSFYLNSEVFTPNGDSYEDVLHIYYALPQEGYISTMKIYSPTGNYLSTLLESEILSEQGDIVWQGVDDRGDVLPVGVYVIVIEALHPEGGLINEKIVVVIGS